MIGLMPASVAVRQKSNAPNMLPWSVTATAGIPCSTAASMRGLTRAAPSSIEYSLCTWRWTKESLEGTSSPGRGCGLKSTSDLRRSQHVQRVLQIVRVGGGEGHPLPRAGVLEGELDGMQPLPAEAQPR